jgi:hypothetical protein
MSGAAVHSATRASASLTRVSASTCCATTRATARRAAVGRSSSRRRAPAHARGARRRPGVSASSRAFAAIRSTVTRSDRSWATRPVSHCSTLRRKSARCSSVFISSTSAGTPAGRTARSPAALVAAPGMDAATPRTHVDLVVRRLRPHVETPSRQGSRFSVVEPRARRSGGGLAAGKARALRRDEGAPCSGPDAAGSRPAARGDESLRRLGL